MTPRPSEDLEEGSPGAFPLRANILHHLSYIIFPATLRLQTRMIPPVRFCAKSLYA